MFEEEKLSARRTLKERITSASENIEELSDAELKSLYDEISKNKMKRKIQRKARVITAKEKYHKWSNKRSKEKLQKKGNKLEKKIAKIEKKYGKK